MTISIREEVSKDHLSVNALIEAAFKNEEFSDKNEHHLVSKLRISKSFIPQLSLVAVTKDQIVGHILFTKLIIRNTKQEFKGLALAPVSVLPKFQNNRIGSQLIEEGHRTAKNLNFAFSLLIGHENYYPKFGYKPVNQIKIKMPFEVPAKNCMIYFFNEKIQDIKGKVIYDKYFFS